VRTHYLKDIKMKKVTLLLLAIASMTCLAAQIVPQSKKADTHGRRSAGSWYVFTGPEGEFTLSFPKRPGREADSEGQVTLIRTYDAVTDDGMYFSINFQDIGGDPRATENNTWASFLEPMVTEAARNRGERVVQVHRLARNVVELELWQTIQPSGTTQNTLQRSILRRSRIYTLGCASFINGKEVNRSICRRFFQSLRFIK
jgi:hypothetical protein